MRDISIRNWQKEFAEDKYNDFNVGTQIEAGWYDWFCNDWSLRNKTYKLARIINKLKGGKVDLDKNYVFFKNNCPCVGKLYDSLKICDIKTGDVIFCIDTESERENYRYVVYGQKNGHGDKEWSDAVYETNYIRELVHWLNTNW